MTEQEAIEVYVPDLSTIPTPGRVSCLLAVVRDARAAAGRNRETGTLDANATQSWLGTVGYFIALDQIGSAVRHESCSNGRAGTAIERVLEQFSSLPQKERSMLYALRNAILHDYSLINNQTGRPELFHVFTLLMASNSTLARFPEHPWDGSIQSISSQSATIVNIGSFGELAEGVLQVVVDAAKAGKLRLNLDGGIQELLSRYTFTVGVPLK